MEWIFVVVLAGSIVTSGHSSREACDGRKATFEREYRVSGQCINMNWESTVHISTVSPTTVCINGQCPWTGVSK